MNFHSNLMNSKANGRLTVHRIHNEDQFVKQIMCSHYLISIHALKEEEHLQEYHLYQSKHLERKEEGEYYHDSTNNKDRY